MFGLDAGGAIAAARAASAACRLCNKLLGWKVHKCRPAKGWQQCHAQTPWSFTMTLCMFVTQLKAYWQGVWLQQKLC
jgi:hypothetical protein